MFEIPKKKDQKMPELQPVGLEGWSVKRAAQRYFREKPPQRAWLARDGGCMFLIVDQNLYREDEYLQGLRAAVAAAGRLMRVKCVPYAQLQDAVRASSCRMFYLRYGEKNVKWSLDDHGFAYLTAHLDADGVTGSYSLDFEKAGDSHYRFSAADALPLENHIAKLFPGATFPEGMRKLLADLPDDEYWRSEQICTDLLRKLSVSYEEFHFD